MLSQVRSQVDSFYPVSTFDLVIRNIEIDSTVQQAIANKLVREQEMLGYDYVLLREEKEEERRWQQ